MQGRIRALFAVLTLATSSAIAHGDWPPKHGGLMSEGGEITFELVADARDVTLYVEDHGEPVATEGATGTIEVRNANDTKTASLSAPGSNQLVASGLELTPGDHVRVRAMLPNRRMLLGRLVIR